MEKWVRRKWNWEKFTDTPNLIYYIKKKIFFKIDKMKTLRNCTENLVGLQLLQYIVTLFQHIMQV